MTENYIQLYFIGKKKQVDQLRNILKQLGFRNEKIILNARMDDENRGYMIKYNATDNEINAASEIFKHIKIVKGKI